MPVWDSGQGLFNNDTDKAVARRGAAESLSDALNFGSVKLKITDDSIGFERHTSASASSNDYLEKKNQRTCLYSNTQYKCITTDANSVNNVEHNWLYKKANVLFPCKIPMARFVASKTGVHMPSHGLAATDTVNIYGSSIDGTNKLVDAVSFDSDSEYIFYGGGPPSANATVTQAKKIPIYRFIH